MNCYCVDLTRCFDIENLREIRDRAKPIPLVRVSHSKHDAQQGLISHQNYNDIADEQSSSHPYCQLLHHLKVFLVFNNYVIP